MLDTIGDLLSLSSLGLFRAVFSRFDTGLARIARVDRAQRALAEIKILFPSSK